MNTEMGLKGKAALITGGNSGIRLAFRLCALGVVVGVLTTPADQTTVLAGSRHGLSADHPEILVGRWVLDLKQSTLESDP
jgi:NAD(P)-dependent dehydrogenase (short-subunit alcohol dehydrogenase family)